MVSFSPHVTKVLPDKVKLTIGQGRKRGLVIYTFVNYTVNRIPIEKYF